tara:strand:+ start:403 stop:606 length:204 start_codon:yes stop_codon:yes gene_type:complete
VNAVKTHAILFLNDGETWSGVDGASICLITEDQMNDLIDETTQPEDITPIFELGLRDYTLLQPKGNQ